VDNILKESDESRIDRLSRGKQPLSHISYHDYVEKFNKESDFNTQSNK
jgi:hypothetical protein